MANDKKSRGSSLHRTYHINKGLRKKLYKKIKQKLLETGVEFEQVDATIEALKENLFVIEDAELLNDIKQLKYFDRDIERLERKLGISKSEESQGPSNY